MLALCFCSVFVMGTVPYQFPREFKLFNPVGDLAIACLQKEKCLCNCYSSVVVIKVFWDVNRVFLIVV